MKGKVGKCDNTDCKNNKRLPIYQVELSEDFKSDLSWWCLDCLNKDKLMIKEK